MEEGEVPCFKAALHRQPLAAVAEGCQGALQVLRGEGRQEQVVLRSEEHRAVDLDHAVHGLDLRKGPAQGGLIRLAPQQEQRQVVRRRLTARDEVQLRLKLRRKGCRNLNGTGFGLRIVRPHKDGDALRRDLFQSVGKDVDGGCVHFPSERGEDRQVLRGERPAHELPHVLQVQHRVDGLLRPRAQRVEGLSGPGRRANPQRQTEDERSLEKRLLQV